jgi:glycosyltransferase involved in cell wall biosynthesis
VTVTLVTCSYQQGDFLESTIRSVLDQAHPGLEYIVIDGGSTDCSVDVIRRHAAALTYWVSEPDAGQTDALIKGFARATGDILGWLCSDDLLLPGALARVEAFFEAHPQVDAVYGDALWIDANGDVLRAKKEQAFSRFCLLFDHNYIPQPSMFWRRGLYERVGGLDRSFDLAMDADLWERFSRAGRIRHMPHYLSCMRFYDAQKTRRLTARGAEERARIRQRSPLASIPGVASALPVLARACRVALKAQAGGYGVHVDTSLLDAVRRYRPAGPSISLPAN